MEHVVFSDFLKQVKGGVIDRVYISDDQKTLQARTVKGESEVVTLPVGHDTVADLMDGKIRVEVLKAPNPKAGSEFVESIIQFLYIGVFIIIGGSILRSSMGGNLPAARGMMKNNRINKEDHTNVKFSDVGGNDEAKQDLREIVEFLKDPEKYTKVGAKIPRGVIMYGPPGCSKTLLARAVAGEADVPFFACSGSEFIEMFVGLGAARIRNLFEDAKKAAPCIVFIDEIDAVAKTRGGGSLGPANDERDQTINQLLTNMDGFEGNTGVIVMASTNRIDTIDPALLRPGRMDRKIAVDLPDYRGRCEILAIHTRGKPIDTTVNVQYLAKTTVGFSGADLANLCNEAAIFAARRNRETITQPDFDTAFEKMVLGNERSTMLVTEQKKRLVATHEAGHALMGLLLNDFDSVRKVSIVPRGNTGGATYFEPTEDRMDMSLLTREYLENKILVAYGGRVAEELVFGESQITTGASGDLQEVYKIAYQMVTVFGFNNTLGKAALTTASDAIGDKIQEEIRAICDRLYNKAKMMMTNNMSYLQRITLALIEKETLTEDDLKALSSQI
jgi:cell division protease FtsH